ncbi:endonuclease MutS2 [Armatimonas rosea]|uniref:Endonuclease MutS2 n=1 Tax=Armatimonas rosea TaxID=685828 RepID=A0A7W9W7L5_ARMRO|nr:endonuclease MutS2 [Armatimonas rosea]MBB6052594.1 DNA mismatch repair protein MutS2 [Armatimonas rosea]
MDDHSLRVLEFDAVRGLLAERAACALGAERARELTPSPLFAFIQEWQQETTEVRKVTDAHGPFPLGGIQDIRRSLAHADVGQNLTPHEFLTLSSTLVGASRLKQFLVRHAEKAPLLSDRALGIQEYPRLLAEIELCIGRSGDVLDSASPALAAARAKIRVTQRRVDEKLNAVLNSSVTRGMLMDPTVVLRDGRRCLPVKAEFKRQLPGIVHDQSGTGATVFIEPLIVVELNNELRQLEAAEQAEIEKVLKKLTESVKKVNESLFSTIEIVGGLDLASAKGKLADDFHCVAPKLNQKGYVALEEARHPLLDQENVVPITVHLGDDATKALLITGPNTGGKTVTLKTVGLFTLMAQSGLHVPARSAELAHFTQVFADIGDEQSITHSLSTFSAHIRNIVRILKTLGTQALVLLDEIGSGTDPAEGAALAKAILGDLLAHNARVIATTHYGELKEFAYSRDGIDNAAVEFNPETLRPTYRILQGVPGSSNAFHIARRLGMPPRVVDAAVENQNRAGAEAATVMQRLEKAKRSAENERENARKLRRELDVMKLKYEERLRDLESLRKEAKERATEEARAVIRQKTEKMDNLIGELRRMGKEGRKTQSTRKKMKDTTDELIGEIGWEKEPLPLDEAPIPTVLKKGERVRVTSLGNAVGNVLADSVGKEVQVQVGAMRVTVPLSALRTLNGVEIAALPAPKVESATNAGALAMTKTMTVSHELTVIGLRADAALPRVDKWLDDAYTAGLLNVRIVHGKGTGALRKAIWETLKTDNRVLSFAMAHPDFGGAGATELVLRQ